MTAAAQQRIMNIAKTLPDEAEGPVTNFMVKFIRTEQPKADVSGHIGIAEGRFETSDDFDNSVEIVLKNTVEPPKLDYEYVRSQGGSLHHLADPSKIPLEEGAWAKAAVEKYKRKMEEMYEAD